MLINLMALLKKGIFESLWFKGFLLIMTITCNSCQKTDLSKKQDIITSETGDALAITAPNVVLILADDFGYEIPSINGGESYNTPNIDQLARDGISFTQSYASSNCSPSRFRLLSGKYNFRNYTEWGVMNRNTRTLGNMFSNAGYNTCYVGKWQLDGGDTSMHAFGFNDYSVCLPYRLEPEESGGPRYKDAPIYQAGKFFACRQYKWKIFG